MEENNISIFNNEVEPVELRLGSIPDVPLVKFNPPESDYEKNRRDRDKEISIFNAPDPVNNFSITENIGKISNTPTYATGTSRSVEDLSELSDYDVLTGESPYGSGKDDYMYRHQSTMEALGKTAWNAMPNLISGLTMTPSAAYSIADRNFGTDNPYENPLSAVSDWAQEKKYRVWGKDGQLDLSDALGIIEQIPMALGIRGGTVATLAPAAFVGAELGLGAVAGTSLGFGVTVGEVGSAIAMAYAEGRDGARGTFKDKYNQIYKETGNDEYAKRIAETAASVETNTNILLNTALNIIPAKWLLKNNKLKAIDDVLEDTGLLNKFKPYQLADESLEEFTDRMKSFTPGTKTNLNRGVLDYAGKWSDLVYNVKNPGELLNRKLDIVGEIFGEGLEEYNNYYAHELAMSINNEKDVQKLNGVLTVPLSQIGSDITNAKMLKDMANNKGLYDFASGAIVSALTSPFMKKFKLNRSKVYNEETGEYDYKYKRGDSNPFKNIPYFEYQNSDYDALDVEQQALNSLKTINQMNNLVASYNDATDMDIKDGFIQQITNIPLSKHLNQKTINVYNALLDNQIKGLGEKNKSIVNDDTLIETVSKGLDTSIYSYITAQDKTKLEDRVKKYKDVSALIAANVANGLDVTKEEVEKTGFLKEIKDIGSIASKAINKHQAELKTQLDYSKNLAKDYNETIEYFTKQGVTRDNDYGFVNAYFLNKINNKEESKLHDKILQKYNTLQKEITDELVKNDTDGYKTKQAAYELLKKKEETLSDEIDKKEKEVAKLISRSDPNDTIYIDTLINEINNAKAELTDLRTKDTDGKTNIEKLVMTALKELSDIQSRALSNNAQLMDYGDNLTKSRIRLRQYEIENKHLTDSSYGDETDTILQKLHMKIQAHRNGDNLLSAISKYEQIVKFLETSGITADPLEFGVFTDDEKETLRRHRQFNEYVLEYEDIANKNKDNKQGHYLSKYFKANKRFVDELEKYEKSKEEVQYYHRQLYRLSETDDINYYAEFMSIFSNLQKYVNEEGNIYNLDKDRMKDAIDNYNRYYQNALNYIDELEKHYKDLEASDGVNRKMFTERTENLKYFIMSKTKEIERLSEMYNYKLAQDTNKELSDLYISIRNSYKPSMAKDTWKASIELQLTSYKRYISNYDKVVEMLVNNTVKSAYYDKKAVDSTKYYHKYGAYNISIDKVMEYDTTTNKFKEKEVYLVNGKETILTLIKIDDTGQLLFTNQNNPLLSDELKAIKTKDIVPDDYLFTDVNGKEIKYEDLKDFESVEEKLGNTFATKLINIDGDIYYKDVTADFYKIVDNKGELILLNDIVSKYPVDAPFQLHVPVKGVFLIDNQIYTSNGDTLERNPDTQFYYITDKINGDIKIFTIKNIVGTTLTIEVSYGNDSIKEETISFSQDIIPTPSKADTDYVNGMVAFIDDYTDATGKFDYAAYKSKNEADTIHKVIINLVDDLISQNKKSNFYLHTISNRLVSPFIDIIRNSKLSFLIDLVHNNINKDYPNDIVFNEEVKKTKNVFLFNRELKESNYETKIDDYIKAINHDGTKKDTQLREDVLAGITARLEALKASTWRKDMVYDLYQILKEYNDLVNDPANLKVSYKFEDKRDINVNTTINLTENNKIVTYKYASHKYVLTDTGLKVEVMYTTDGIDADLNDSSVIKSINNGSIKPIILTLNVEKDLKTTPDTLKRVTVDKDIIAYNSLTEDNLQNKHGFDLFASKVLKVSGKQISVNNTTNPLLFDRSSYNQDRTAISRDNMIQLKRLIALFSTDTNGRPVDVYKDIFGGVINDTIIIEFINNVFGSMDVFQKIAINADKVTFTRKITPTVVIDTVNGVEHKHAVEKPIINTSTSGSNVIIPEEIIPEPIDKSIIREPILGDTFTSESGRRYIIRGFTDKGGIQHINPEGTAKGVWNRGDFDNYIKEGRLWYDIVKSDLDLAVERIEKERNMALVAARPKNLALDKDGNLIEAVSGATHALDFTGAFSGGIMQTYQQIYDALVNNTTTIAGLPSIETIELKPLYDKGLIKSKVEVYHRLNEKDINAKYDKLIEDLYNNQPKETDKNIDRSIIDTNNEFLKLQKEIDSILKVNNDLRVKTIDKINAIEKVLGYGLNIDEENTLFAVEYIVDNNTWEISDKEPKEIVGMYEKDNWEIIMSIYNAYKTKIKPNKVKIANIEKEKFNLLSTPTGLELRRAWSLGKVDESTMLQLTTNDYIEKTSTDGKDIYTGYYYSLGKGKIDYETIEQVIGDSIQEVIAELNVKYDAEIASLSGDAKKPSSEFEQVIDEDKFFIVPKNSDTLDYNFNLKKDLDKINNNYDEEYSEAVIAKKITKIEALQALIAVGRKGSDTYNKLLNDLVEEKISEGIAGKGDNIRFSIKNNGKIIPADNLNEIDIAFDITIDVTVLPPVDLSIPDEFDMLLEAPYEYISEALLNRDFPTVADNSNHHKVIRHSSVLNTNTEIDHTVPIGKNYTISHRDEDKKAYKEGLHEKLHNNTGIKNVTLEVMPISVSYHENGSILTKKLDNKKEQYDFYYEIFSKLNETALKGYIESMGYNLLDNILDGKGNLLFGFLFSDIATNKDKIIRFLADLKINYVFMNEDKSKIYGSLHDYAYLLAKGIRVETISDSAISSLKILRDTAKQHEDNLNNSISSDKPIYNLSYLDNGYIRIFKDFSINPPPLTERRNLYYNSKIALARQDTETFKIYLNKTNSGANGVLKYNQDTLDTTIANMNEEELRSIYRLLLYKANRVLKLNIPPIPPGTDIDSNELITWIEDVLTPNISGNFIIYGAKITNNISKESTHIPLYTIKFKQLLPSINLTIDNNFVDDNGKVIRSIKETKEEIEEYHNNLVAAINNINLTEIKDTSVDRKNMLEVLGNFAHIEIESKDVKDWAKKLAKAKANGKSFEGTSIAVYNNNNTNELTLYLYSNIKNEKGEDVKTITSISYKSSKKPLIKNSIYLSTSDDFIDANSFTLQPDKLLEKFMNAYLSVDVTANNADKNILLRTITHVNGLNDEVFVNPLLKIEDTQTTKTVTPTVVATDNNNTPNTTLPTELIAIQGLIDLYEEFITGDQRKDKSYLISGIKTIIKPYNGVTDKVEIVYKLIINNDDIKKLMSKYKSLINSIINKGDTIDVTTIYDISKLKLFVKKDDIYYINANYNNNDINEDVATLKGLEIDKKIPDCK